MDIQDELRKAKNRMNFNYANNWIFKNKISLYNNDIATIEYVIWWHASNFEKDLP